jgi:3-hydroxyisobutyrate dehydrogenase
MKNSLAPPLNVGFIGLGNMGAPMAGHLVVAGYRLYVMDTAPAAVSRFAEKHACEQPRGHAELAAACPVVITMLPNGDIVREVLTGEDGVAAGLEPGAIVIDMSSSSPLGTRRLAQELAERNIILVDAPVSGGVVKAEQGALSIMAGGDEEVVTRCAPLFGAMGKAFHTGISGTGHAMKALNNFLSAGTLALTAEAVLAGERFGLEPERMVEIINASTGRSNSSEHKYPTFVLNRRFNSGFALGLMAKDLRLALELARAGGTASELIQDVSELWSRAEAQLGAAADNTDIVRYLEAESGVASDD